MFEMFVSFRIEKRNKVLWESNPFHRVHLSNPMLFTCSLHELHNEHSLVISVSIKIWFRVGPLAFDS
jgi:hypothetical protein